VQANPAIETVRGRLDDAVAAEILEFWGAHSALTGEEARARLPEVVCVLRDAAGAVAGVSSVFAADVPLVGGRRFWVFRSLLPSGVAEQLPALIRETFAALDTEFDGAPGSPVGLCVLLDEAERRRRPEAEWTDPRMIYAGYLDDGRQVRVAYFDQACITPGEPRDGDGRPLSDRYRIVVFAEQDAVTGDDIVDLWAREGVLPPEEAQRRVSELLLVALDEDDGPAGVTTAYLQRSEQLRMDMWHYRAFVATAHRESEIATWLAVLGRDHLRERFVSAADTRAPGVIYEVENPTLKAYFAKAHWLPTDFLYIGDSPIGAHVRVHWFPGARAPEPGQGST
jgi:hypothetical protein